jgi:hypothetical protein
MALKRTVQDFTGHETYRAGLETPSKYIGYQHLWRPLDTPEVLTPDLISGRSEACTVSLKAS